MRKQFITWFVVVGLATLLMAVVAYRDRNDTQSPLAIPASRPGPPDIESELQRAAELQRDAERQADGERPRDLGSPRATAPAWVLWSRIQDATHRDRWEDWTRSGSALPTFSQCWAKIHQHTGIAEEGSWADWYQWARGLGRYTKQRNVVATESGVWVMGPLSSEWRCLPDAVDPREQKGK